MATPPTVHYNPRGYKATYDPASDTCAVAVRGFIDANGRIVERGGPAYPDDKVVNRLMLTTNCASLAGCPDSRPLPRVVDTFHDALVDRRDLLGVPMFRHKPADDAERRLFAAAYDAAQKIRSKMNVLSVGQLFFSLVPSLFAIVDCFSRDSSGAFWLMNARKFDGVVASPAPSPLSLAAYVLEAGEYIPSTAVVRLGVWFLTPAGPRFAEVPNNRVAARDAVIAHILKPPF